MCVSCPWGEYRISETRCQALSSSAKYQNHQPCPHNRNRRHTDPESPFVVHRLGSCSSRPGCIIPSPAPDVNGIYPSGCERETPHSPRPFDRLPADRPRCFTCQLLPRQLPQSETPQGENLNRGQGEGNHASGVRALPDFGYPFPSHNRHRKSSGFPKSSPPFIDPADGLC